MSVTAEPRVDNMPSPLSIAVLMIQGIGDVICATPIVLGLRQAYPKARIVGILKGPTEADLFGGASALDRVIYCDPGRTRTPGGVLALLRELRRERLDAFVVATDIDAIKAPILSWLSGACWRVGESWSVFSRLYTHRVLRHAQQHKVRSNWDILGAFGIEARPDPCVHIADEDREQAMDLLRRQGIGDDARLVAIHPGSGEAERHKRWPEAKYVELIRELGSRLLHRVVLVGGPEEIGLCERIRRDAGDIAVNLAGQMDIRQTAAVLQRSEAVVGADSGIMHLAGACGARTVSLFGPTSPARTATHRVDHIITRHLPCSPCYPRLPRGCDNPVCMRKIMPSDVMSCLREILLW